MNKLYNREYHEAVSLGIVKTDIAKSISLGNALQSRIPYNQLAQLREEKESNNYKLTEEEIEKLLPRLNFNLPQSNLKLMEYKFVQEKDYLGLFNLLKNDYPYNLLDDLYLYSYVRSLCGETMKKIDYQKIRSDKKYIKKVTKAIEEKKTKKEKGKVNVSFN